MLLPLIGQKYDESSKNWVGKFPTCRNFQNILGKIRNKNTNRAYNLPNLNTGFTFSAFNTSRQKLRHMTFEDYQIGHIWPSI